MTENHQAPVPEHLDAFVEGIEIGGVDPGPVHNRWIWRLVVRVPDVSSFVGVFVWVRFDVLHEHAVEPLGRPIVQVGYKAAVQVAQGQGGVELPESVAHGQERRAVGILEIGTGNHHMSVVVRVCIDLGRRGRPCREGTGGFQAQVAGLGLRHPGPVAGERRCEPHLPGPFAFPVAIQGELHALFVGEDHLNWEVVPFVVVTGIERDHHEGLPLQDMESWKSSVTGRCVVQGSVCRLGVFPGGIVRSGILWAPVPGTRVPVCCAHVAGTACQHEEERAHPLEFWGHGLSF